MRAIEFIESDIKRTKVAGLRLVLISVSLVLVPIGIGFGTRDGFAEAFNLGNLWPPALMLLILSVFPWIYVSHNMPGRSKWLLLGTLLAIVLLLSLGQPQTPISLDKFSSPEKFWPEALHCLFLGIIGSFIASTVLIVFLLKFLPTPNRNWQRVCALVAGICGLATLTFHCMGSLVSHTLVAHWGQALLIFPIAFLQQRLLFKNQINKVFGKNTKLKQLEKMAD